MHYKCGKILIKQCSTLIRKGVLNRMHQDSLLILKCSKLDGLINEFQGIVGFSYISDRIKEFSPCLVEMTFITQIPVVKLVQHFTNCPASSASSCPLKTRLQATEYLLKQGLHTNSGKCLALHIRQPCFHHQIASCHCSVNPSCLGSSDFIHAPANEQV